jgi:signal transduction histidine kinase/ActR/RegA family two-component response regulator
MSDRGTSRRGGAGRLARIIAAAWRQRRRLREARARAEIAEARLRAVVDAMPEGIVLLDAEGRYVLWNQRYSEIYHRSADMFAPGARLMDTLRVGVARGDYPEAVGREEAWLAERESWLRDPGQRHEQQISDGRWLMIEERRTADGGVIGLRVDITDMKRQAQALERAVAQAEAANVAKSEFLANMSHEIRTPLHGVLGMAQVMARDELSAEQAARLGVIRRSGDALLGLLNDLLDLSKIEAGKLELHAAPFDLETVVAGACAPFEGLAQEKAVALRVQVAQAARGGWMGDGPRLQQVLANLVSNAVKFTDEGEVAIRVEATGHGLKMQISDTGIGIPQDRMSALFEKFSQVESSTSRRFAGTGLGLSISRQLMQMMGGDLFAASRFGGGSTFTLTAPLTRAAAPVSEEAPASEMRARRPGDGRPRVLAAEDNPTNQMILRALLEPLDLELVMAGNGEEAVAAFAREPFDLVLMDIQMPDVDGLAATRRIRAAEAQRGDGAVTPIVALSANVMTHQIAEYLAAGMDDVVPKPVEAERLFAAVIGALSRPQVIA